MKKAHVKNGKPTAEWHTSHDSAPMGDNYGSGIKNKIGKMRSNSVGIVPVSKKGLNTPPRSLA